MAFHSEKCAAKDQRITDLGRQLAEAKAGGESLRSLIARFDAAIHRIAAELTDQACCGVDTGDEINPETGEPYGRGGHTGWLLTTEAQKLKAEIEAMRPVVSMLGEVANTHRVENWQGLGQCMCLICVTWREYESRKKP